MPRRTALFFTNEENDKIKQYIKENIISLSDLHLLVKVKINCFYNELLDSLYSRKLIDDKNKVDPNQIIYRETVEDMLRCRDIPIQEFHLLIEEGYISVCGSGYVFEKPQQRETETEEDYNRLMYLMYDLGLAA